MISSALVGLNAFLRSSNLPGDGLSGQLLNFYWHDGLTIPHVNPLTIQKKTLIVYLLIVSVFF